MLHSFSALIDGKSGKYWTRAYNGNARTAKRFLDEHPNAIECSLYRGGRFVRTIKRDDRKREEAQ